LYVLDGEMFFLNAVGVMDFLSKNDQMPPMIVVGLLNTDRSRDFAPSSSPSGSPFLRFLATELFPLVEARYPAEPCRMIAGYSLAGSLVVQTFLDQPELFTGYMAMSPNLLYGDEFALRRAGEAFSRPHDVNKTVYLGIGGAEEADAKDAQARFITRMRTTAPPRFRLAADEVAGADHNSVRDSFLPRALARTFEGWGPAGEIKTVADAREHYRELSERFGFIVRPPQALLRRIGQRYLQSKELVAAVAAFRAAADEYPGSPLTHAELGEALEKTGAIAEARQELRKAVSVAAGSAFASSFEQRLAAFEKRVSAK
jgi:predicted alpha/beta superfamily hydrolase